MHKTVIYTVPKSGTHFVSNITSLLKNIDNDISTPSSLYNVVGHIKTNKQINDSSKEFFSTHVMYIKPEEFQKNINSICVIRNPIDTAISFYYFYETRKEPSKQSSIYEYLKITIPKICKEILKLVKFNLRENSILIKYDELITNEKDNIRKIFNFLNKYHSLNDYKYDILSKKINIKNMKKNEKDLGKYLVGTIQKFNFYRSGKIGQWKEHLTNEQFKDLLNLVPKDLFSLFENSFNSI